MWLGSLPPSRHKQSFSTEQYIIVLPSDQQAELGSVYRTTDQQNAMSEMTYIYVH